MSKKPHEFFMAEAGVLLYADTLLRAEPACSLGNDDDPHDHLSLTP